MDTRRIILTIIVTILIILITIVSLKIINKIKLALKYRYTKVKCIMTKTEIEYYLSIKRILSRTDYIIQPQVPLSQLVTKDKHTKYQNELNRVVDFVILSSNFEPLICIEINDPSHYRKDRIERDKKVTKILKSAKLPLLTIWTKERYDEKSFKKELIQEGLKL